MNKPTYTPPVITIVDFQVDRGYNGSVETLSVAHSFSRKDDYSNYYYSGDEEISDYTDNSGNLSSGSWSL